MKEYLKRFYTLYRSLFFDPFDLINRWRGVPYYIRNFRTYRELNSEPAFKFRWADVIYTSFDRFGGAGSARGHYFWQDLWAARFLFSSDIKRHVDVGSRLDGFIAHILPFCRVIYVDIRPLEVEINNLEFRMGSILEMPFKNNSQMSLSCLHVIEHIGLGRYGDPINPTGHLLAAKELSRILAPSGKLLIGTPVGRERLCFDAHRVFDPQTIIDAFDDLSLVEFNLIDDSGMGIIHNASLEQAQKCAYGCGLFVFEK